MTRRSRCFWSFRYKKTSCFSKRKRSCFSNFRRCKRRIRFLTKRSRKKQRNGSSSSCWRETRKKRSGARRKSCCGRSSWPDGRSRHRSGASYS